jgi:hypothetical protein
MRRTAHAVSAMGAVALTGSLPLVARFVCALSS